MRQDTKTCNVAGCEFASSGSCKMGHKPDECKERFQPAKSQTLSIPNALELDSEGATAILRRGWARVIILAGGVRSGKTTLIASLYQQFQNGPFANQNFAGSETLHAWERYCHPSRTASLASQADSDRTRLEPQFSFVHLRLRPSNSIGESTDYLFSNVSGELFEAMRDDPKECVRARCLLRADRLLFLLDGEKLTAQASRASVVADTRTLVRRLLDTGALDTTVPIDLLASKWDKVMAAKAEGPVAVVLDNLVASLRSHANPPKTVAWFRLAARPATTHQPLVELEQVLSRCVAPMPELEEPRPSYEPAAIAPGMLRFREPTP